jgi:hypothetical protein
VVILDKRSLTPQKRCANAIGRRGKIVGTVDERAICVRVARSIGDGEYESVWLLDTDVRRFDAVLRTEWHLHLAQVRRTRVDCVEFAGSTSGVPQASTMFRELRMHNDSPPTDNQMKSS